MRSYVTDTHSIVWHLTNSRKLSKRASQIFRAADEGRAQVLVPAIVLVEAVFIADRQRMSAELVDWLFDLRENEIESYQLVPLNQRTVQHIRDFGPAAVPELADRIIAATARALNLPLLTADPTISESDLVQVVW
jgi:PIN domain nuclease of toxin-antitoxin system